MCEGEKALVNFNIENNHRITHVRNDLHVSDRVNVLKTTVKLRKLFEILSIMRLICFFR